jgi:HEAT repeat protein
MGIRNVARVRGLALNGDVLGLIQVLSDRLRSGPERRVAAAALGDLRDKRAVEPLVSVLDDDKVCTTAVRALAAIGDPIAAAPLAELYSSTRDRTVRKEAEKALYGLNSKDPRGVRSVLESYERAKNKHGGKSKHE